MLLFTSWIATTAALVTIAAQLENWLTPEGKDKLARFVDKRLMTKPQSWIHEVSGGFLLLFDRIYGWKQTSISRAIWIGVFFIYVSFPLARLVLRIFDLPTPSTELILGAALCFSSFAVLVAASIFHGVKYLNQVNNGGNGDKDEKPILNLIVSTTLGMAALYLGVTGTALIVHGMGVTPRLVFALSFGACFALPSLLLVYQIPTRLHPIGPFKSISSSLLWLTVLCLAFPDVAATLMQDPDIQRLVSGQIKSVSTDILDAVANNNASWVGPVLFLVYNLFADMVSLAETRFILRMSLNKKISGVLFLLFIDIVISAFIYVILPVIAGQDLYHLWQAIFFTGPVPYLGILFWSTFTTSLIFYLFVISSGVLYVLSPLSGCLKSVSSIFGLSTHPIRAITTAMVMLISISFAVLGVVN